MRLARTVLSTLALGVVLGGIAAPAAQAAPVTPPADPLARINHIIVIYQENWSFDSLYGKFPGANGLANAGNSVQQVDKNGQPYTVLPPALNTSLKPVAPDTRVPTNLPVAPYDLTPYIPPGDKSGDLVHRYYQNQYQIDGGKNDKYVAWSDAAGLAMSYYDASNMPEGQLAQQYVMADNLFASAFGGSFLNHQLLVCACAPTWPNAPVAKVAKLDANGILVTDGAVTPDGYAINTSYSINSPHPANITDTTQLVPEQTAPTIGDRLNDKGISWAWYSGGWNDAVAGHPNALFQYHHQPFAFYANYADGTPGRAAHLRDEQDFMRALTTNELPAVSFIKPMGLDNEHPGYANEAQGQQHVADLVKAVQNSPYWADSAIVITYDEFGGRWDHVAPPVIDRWGPGTRVPGIIISPLAKKGFVDHTQYETVSVLKTIEERWGLAALGTRDAAAHSFANAFEAAAPAPAPAPGMPTTGSPVSPIQTLGLLLAGVLAGLAGALLRRRAA